MNGLKKSLALGYILAISGGIFWAVGGACGQYLFQHNHMTSNWLVPVRLTVSGILLLLFALVRRQNIMAVWKNRRDIADILLFGLLGSALCQYGYYTSIQYSNVALATVLAYMSPAMILVYTVIRERRLPLLYEAVCVLLVIAGAYTCTTHLNPQSLAVTPEALFWGLISAASFVVYTLQPRRLLQKFDLVMIIGWGMVIGGITLILLFRPWTITVTVNPSLYLNMAIVILFGTVFSFCFYQAGVSIVGSITGSILSSVEPVASMIISVLFLHVPLTVLDFAGFILILASIPIIALGNRKQNNKAIDTAS